MFRLSFFCLFLLVFVSVAGYAQSSNWNNTIDLNVTVNYADRIDLYTDADGNHVIVQKSNQLVYYLFSATGSQIRSSVIDNFSEYPRLSRIAGWEGNVYISYKKSGAILTQKSTDGGANWGDLQHITLPNSTSNGLGLWTDDNGLHIAYSAHDPNNSEYNTYYRMHPHGTGSWQDFKNVTDEANVSGGFPSVTTSGIRVLAAFTAGNTEDPTVNAGIPRTRERWYSNWLYSHLSFNYDAARCMVIANSDKFHGFYYDFVGGWGNYHYDLYYRNRDLESTGWSSAELIQSYADPDYSAIDMAVAPDDKVHVLYGSYDGVYNVWDGDWGTGYTITGQYGSYSQAIAANSNDIYAAWVDWYASTIKLRQRDFAPLAPQNLTVIASGNNHPLLSWPANNEADLDEYNIYKNRNDGWGWQFLNHTSATSYEDASETVYAAEGGAPQIINFKITGVDLEDNESGYSNTVAITVIPRPDYKIGSISSDGTGSNLPPMLLAHNYPNPFNPSTTIQFGLTDSSPVELSVYNLSGQKISILFKGNLDAGYHEANWNGKDQQGKPVSSGIYIYQLKAGDQRIVKKMMLIK